MRLEIITPDKSLFKGEAKLVSVPGVDGSMGFLPRRLMVLDEDFVRAEALLREAVPDAMP